MSTLLRQALCVLSAALTVATAAAALAPAAPAEAPTTIFVNPLGSDAQGCGSSDAFTCKTIQHAVETATTPGDIVSLASGSYDEAVSITTPITLTAGPDETPTVTGPIDVGTTDGDVTVSGLTVEGPGAELISVHDSAADGHVTIADNTLAGGTDPQTAISSLSTTALTVTGNHISGNGHLVGVAVDADTTTSDQVVTGNTFTLGSGGGSAIDLASTGADTHLAVTLGGNTGTVGAPTGTITESGDGTIAVTATAPNTITPDPAPTVALDLPTTIVSGGAAQPFDGVLDANGATIAHARYDVVITGSAAVSHDQLTLYYDDPSTGRTDIPLTGTANADGITGSFGPVAGFPVSPTDQTTTPFTIAVEGAAPTGPLHVAVSLDEVSQGVGHPAVNTVASSANDTVLRSNVAPVADDQTVAVPFNRTASVTLTAADPDSDALSYAIVDQPTKGALSGAAPDLTYTPGAGYTGPDSFTFTASDGSATSTPAIVTLTVESPVAIAQTKNVPLRGATAVTLSAIDDDTNQFVYAPSPPSHGTLRGSGPNLTYTPSATYAGGTDSFTFTVADADHPQAESLPATVTLHVALDRKPVASAQKTVNVAYATSKSITLPASDADGDHLTYQYGQPGFGTLSGSGPVLSYRPPVGRAGATSFTFTASDGRTGGTSNAVRVAILVGKGATTLSIAMSPSHPTSGTVPHLIVSVRSAGNANGGKVTVKSGSLTRTAHVSGGRATVLLVHFAGGTHRISVSFAANATAAAATATKTVTVSKVQSSLTFSTRPGQLTAKIGNGKAFVHVSAQGATVSGPRVTIKEGSRTIGSGTVVHGLATITLPRLDLGQHNLTVSYPGTSTATSARRLAVVRVALG